MDFTPRDFYNLQQSVATRLQFLDQLISQETNRPEDQQGLLSGFVSQMVELKKLNNRLLEAIDKSDGHLTMPIDTN